MSANFTPVFEGYTGQGKFKFWCQKVLPLVYDDSLSYYELLNKMVVYLNNVITDVAAMEDNVQALYNSYNSLQGYVNEHFDELVSLYNQLHDYVENYFANLDVQEEINNKLDDMAESGELYNILEPHLNRFEIIHKTVEDMVADSLLADNVKVKTLGYYSVGDNGGAEYVIQSTQPTTPYITLDNGKFAAMVMKENSYFVEQFGAYGDNSHDDSDAIQACIDAGKAVKFTTGKTYFVTKTLNIHTSYQRVTNSPVIDHAYASVRFSNYDVALYTPVFNCTGQQNVIQGINISNMHEESPRKNYHVYNENQYVSYDGRRYICVQAGTSDYNPPIFNTATGDFTNDGSVVWKCVGTSNVSNDNTTVSEIIVTGIKADFGNNNTDITVCNCRINACRVALDSKGRGPLFFNNRIAGGRIGIRLSMYKETDATDIFMTPTLGGRGARIYNNRAQAQSGTDEAFFITILGDFIGLLVTNNYIESRSGLINYTGSITLRNSIIANNIILGANSGSNPEITMEAMLKLPKCVDCIISNNVIMGVMTQEEFDENGESLTITQIKPVDGIKIVGKSDNLNICNNIISNISSYAIDIFADCTNVTITDNILKYYGNAGIFFRGNISGVSVINNKLVGSNVLYRMNNNKYIIGRVYGEIGYTATFSSSAYYEIETNIAPNDYYYCSSTILNGNIANNAGFNYSVRQNSHAYNLSTHMTLNGYAYLCTTAGTSASSEPAFNTEPCSSTTDGSVVWLCIGKSASPLIQ